MSQLNKYSVEDMSGSLGIYFNWSINALVPFNSKAADKYLKIHKAVIVEISQMLLQRILFVTREIYRGVLLKEPTNEIQPHNNLEYLSFTEDIKIAQSFANINGFGSEVMDLREMLGGFGYVITYYPHISEVLFHYKFLDLLPYQEALTQIGMNGMEEVRGLKIQKEVTIIQPEQPFTQITKQF